MEWNEAIAGRKVVSASDIPGDGGFSVNDTIAIRFDDGSVLEIEYDYVYSIELKTKRMLLER